MVRKLVKSRIYILDRKFLRQDDSLVLDHHQPNYQRLSITVIVASGKPFRVADSRIQDVDVNGLIVGPNLNRVSVSAKESELTIIDAFIGTPAYQKLARLVEPNNGRLLTCNEYDHLNELCKPTLHQHMSITEAKSLYDKIVVTLCGKNKAPPLKDPRVQAILDLVENHQADELSAKFISEQISLSESRIRRLFKEEMNCTLSNYIRQVSFWKSVPHLVNGMNYTDAAHQVGFYDLAHYSRTMKAIFGISPQGVRDYLENAATQIDI